MAKMTDAVRKRLQEIQAAKKADATSPGRGTLRGINTVAWMGGLDALINDEQVATDARTELTEAAVLSVSPMSTLPAERGGQRQVLRLITTDFAAENLDWRADDPLPVVPKKAIYVRRTANRWREFYSKMGTSSYHSFSNQAALVEVSGLSPTQAADLERALGGIKHAARRYVGPSAGTVEKVVTLYPADQIAVLFRLLWFATQSDKEQAAKGNALAPWKHFRAACRKYLVCYTPAWCERLLKPGVKS